MATTWTRADYDAATAADDARRARIADATFPRRDALVCDAVCLAPTECPGVDCRLYASHAAARASGETPLPPQTDPWADSHGGPATPGTRTTSTASPATTKARRGLAEARTDLYDAQTAARTARYAVAVAKAARLRATATLAVVRATEAEARIAPSDAHYARAAAACR